MNDNQIKQIVQRFLTWKLPENFAPDGGISFKPMFNEHTAYPMKNEPVGTNLLNFQQAEAMIRHILEGIPYASIKPLEWEDPCKSNNWVTVARSVFGDYYIGIDGGSHRAFLEAHEKPYDRILGNEDVGTMWEAKADAEADYKDRVIALLFL